MHSMRNGVRARLLLALLLLALTFGNTIVFVVQCRGDHRCGVISFILIGHIHTQKIIW